jgi:phosphoribosylaminoimidazole-succinocarboxamide synthase
MKNDARPSLVETPAKLTRASKGQLIGESEGKAIYHSRRPDLVIQEFTSEGGKKSSRGNDLSALRNEISSYLFGYIEGFHIPTHFVSKFSATSMVVKRTDNIPMTMRIYNTCSGSLMRRLGLRERTPLEFPIIEHFFNAGKKPPTWMNEYHMYALNIVTPEELKQINRLASKVNAVLRGLCDRRKFFVADLQLAFVRFKEQILIGDELSPVTCHFIDLSGEGKRDEDRYSPEQDNAVEMFSELYHRLRVKA